MGNEQFFPDVITWYKEGLKAEHGMELDNNTVVKSAILRPF